ncbi:MAG: hypothetical protein AAF961_06500, partial [Planctomycetota bacterium]
MIDRSTRFAPLLQSLFFAASRPSWKRKSDQGGSRASRGNWSTAGGPDSGQGPHWSAAATRYAGLILLAAAIPTMLAAWVLLFPDHPPTPLLVASVTDYGAPFPPNSMAAEDAAYFDEAYRDYHNIVLTTNIDETSTSADLLRNLEDYLDNATPGGPNQDVVMVFLSAHGAVDDSGRPCLLFPNSDLVDSSTWLPVAEVLSALERPERLADCKKILFLDANRFNDAWRLGIVANTFSIALESLVSARRTSNCLVLNATTGLQRSLSAPELGGTLFGRFTALGLRGAADAAGDRDAVVTVGELEKYLAIQIDAWALRRRGARQRPKLIAAADRALPLANVAGDEHPDRQPWRSPLDAAQLDDVYQRV